MGDNSKKRPFSLIFPRYYGKSEADRRTRELLVLLGYRIEYIDRGYIIHLPVRNEPLNA